MNCFAGFSLSLIHRGVELPLGILPEKRRIDARRDRRSLLLLGRQNVGRALGSGEQVLAVVGGEEGAERFDAADDGEEVVDLALMTERSIARAASA